MFISWRTYNATSGVVATDLPFWCARCGAQCPMQVRTQGYASSVAVYGAGGSAAAAQTGAQADAQYRARTAARFVRCPGCGEVAPDMEAQHAAIVARVTHRARRALPVSAVIGLAACVVLGGAGLLDIGASKSAFVSGLAAGITIFGASLFLLSQTPPVLQPPPAEVWLQWGEWIPGQIAVPGRPPSTTGLKAAGAVLAAVGGLATMIALILWGTTFGSVYVLDADGRATLDMKVDGAPARSLPS